VSAYGGVFRGIHYNTDAEGLIIVVDGDDTEMHVSDHDKLAEGGEGCRLCEVRKIIAHAHKHLRARPSGGGLKVAIGVAVPAIEAWYLVGKEHQVGEAAWRAGLAANQRPFTRPKLKEMVYGTARPSLELETECATKEARRIINNINAIETAFPIGFGLMASEIRSWKS
jgi:hypothetical protein